MTEFDITRCMKPGAKVHLIGIGGVSMNPLAQVLHGMGVQVTGSDARESAAVDHLRGLGIPVAVGQKAENLGDAEMVIRTAAAHDDNPEVAGAHARNIPVFERAQAWGAIMKQYRNALCISGTHGKTTTTGMCTHILLSAGLDPTVMIGATLPVLQDEGHRVGHGDTILLESCEYMDSFLSFFPTLAVVLNVDEDHLDYFKDLDDIEKSFRAFARRVPANTGLVVANADDANTMKTLAGLDRPLITFGLTGGTAHAANLRFINGYGDFDLVWKGETVAHVTLHVPGEHNVRNALAASAACLSLGAAPEAIPAGLAQFTGADRRFEFKGRINGADVYDDYAHHPSELQALLSMTKSLGYKRVICSFQPHTYTRTKALFHELAEVLKEADLAVLTDIFAARETDDLGVSSRDLAKEIPGSEYCPTLAELTARLKELAQPGDLILTVGAGDIVTAGEALVK